MSSINPRKFVHTKLLNPLLTLAMLAFSSSVFVMADKRPVVFQEISLDQGLSQSIVECILQDNRGFMWFGTEDGANRYDGYGFTVLRHDPVNVNSLSYNEITSMAEDRNGNIWIGTFYGGVNRYDPNADTVKRFRAEPSNPNSLSHDNVKVVFVDRSGTVWVGTDGGLNRLNPDSEQFSVFRHSGKLPESISNNQVRCLFEDRAGNFWVGTDDGLNLMNRETGRFRHLFHDPENSNTLTNSEIYTVFVDSGGAVWVGTNRGLNRMNLNSGKVRRFVHNSSDPDSLNHNQVRSVFEDDEGRLWVGTNGGGLDILDRRTGKFIHHVANAQDSASISYNEVTSIYEDRSRNLWVGTYGGGVDKINLKRKGFKLYRQQPGIENTLSQEIVWSILEDENGILWLGTHGGGLNRFDRSSGVYTHYLANPADPDSLSNNIVRVVFQDSKKNIWVGTHGGGLNLLDRRTGKFTQFRHDPDNPASLSHDQIRVIYEDKSGRLWIGTYGGGLNLFNRQDKTFSRFQHSEGDPGSISSDFVRSVLEDRFGNLWIGTQGGGLNLLDRRTGKFTHFRHSDKNLETLSNDYIFCLYEDKAGNFWIGTWGSGLNQFDRDTGRFHSYTEKDGLADNAIYGILEDEEGRLWLSTNNGLSTFNPTTKKFRNYDVKDGLQSNEFNGGSFFKSKSGEMFFGGIHGFNAFYPNEIKNNPFVPPIHITAFLKFNEKTSLRPLWNEGDEIVLSYTDYVFSFEFAGLEYTAPEKNLYAYKMEGLDDTWIKTTADKRFASYTTLAPGNYTFHVKGSNNDGVWNDTGTFLRVKIVPPIWKTWPFRIFVLALVLILGITWVRMRMKNFRISCELMAAQRAQMSIMPQEDPIVDCFDISGACIPAHEVGGDFYDYFWFNGENKKFGIAIGDVSGKALDSAMVAVMASGMIYSRISEAASVSSIMSRINRPMYDKTERRMFTALCLVALNVEAREFVFSNAGLPDPLLKSDEGLRSMRSAGSKLPLGSSPETAYEERKLCLKPGDLVILFTDGILEAQNRSKEFYGEKRLHKLIEALNVSRMTASEILNRILRNVDKFTGHATQNDDMTLVVIKVL